MLKEHIQYVFLISRKICHICRQWSVGGLWSQVTILYSFAEHLRLGSSTITVCISDDLTLYLFLLSQKRFSVYVASISFILKCYSLPFCMGVVFPSMCVNLSRVLKFQLPQLILALISYNKLLFCKYNHTLPRFLYA